MAHNDLARKIEALLFALGRPLARKELSRLLDADRGDISAALTELQNTLQGGVVLVDDGDEVELRVGAESAALIEKVRKDEYSRDIGKAGLEALSAVLYRGPLTRSEIDFIRGVNSSQTLRTLTLRGLIRKVENDAGRTLSDSARPAGGGRRGSFLYEPTTELLAELGVSRMQDLPDYADVRQKLQTLEESYRVSGQEQKQSEQS